MLYRTQIPRPPLSDFVNVLWFYEGEKKPHDKERLLPDGSVELVINLREDRIRVYDKRDHDKFDTLRGSVICGPHSEFFVIDTAEQGSVVGVHFKPGGAFPFLGLPADEVHDSHVSLENLWGVGAASELREQLIAAPSPERKFQVLEQALLAWAGRELEHHPAVRFALGELQEAPDTQTIAEVSGRVGLSQKSFIDHFREEVGLTPKLFCRVRRFQRAIQSIAQGRTVEWAGVAADCGYFDQAHFIHDFKAFSGLSPTAYLRRRTEHLNHVPIDS